MSAARSARAYDAWLTSGDPGDSEFLCPHCGDPVDESALDWDEPKPGEFSALHDCGKTLWLYSV